MRLNRVYLSLQVLALCLVAWPIGYTVGAGEPVAVGPDGTALSTEPHDVISSLQKLADKGDAEAQCDLGNRYLQGNGVKRDVDVALGWFRKGAESGNVASQYMLGVMYATAAGVAKDTEAAMSWYGKAAQQGYPQAVAALRGMRGDPMMGVPGQLPVPPPSGTDRKGEEAMRYYRQVAEDALRASAFYFLLSHDVNTVQSRQMLSMSLFMGQVSTTHLKAVAGGPVPNGVFLDKRDAYLKVLSRLWDAAPDEVVAEYTQLDLWRVTIMGHMHKNLAAVKPAEDDVQACLLSVPCCDRRTNYGGLAHDTQPVVEAAIAAWTKLGRRTCGELLEDLKRGAQSPL